MNTLYSITSNNFEPQTKKFIFDLLVLKGPSIPSPLNSLRDVAFDLSISNMNYIERVAQTANIS